jgi:hypothetical protein
VKYRKELKSLISSITASGVAVFKATEQDGVLMQSIHAASAGIYYKLLKDEGSAQFRYWIS